MEDYNKSALIAARGVTTTFSTSFTMASRFFDKVTRQHIYNIYGLVRIADEIVDSYTGEDKAELLHNLEQEVYEGLGRKYSPNIIVHAFILTAHTYNIDKSLIKAFFRSMRDDLTKTSYNAKSYKSYIYGSAEVVGLMCLKVFVTEDEYTRLRPGAAALGAAFQKINFLRDIKEDYEERGRYYFPIDTFKTFSDDTKGIIVKDIENDITIAKLAIQDLPPSPKKAVTVALKYYEELLNRLKDVSADQLKTERFRVPNQTKVFIALRELIRI